MMVGRIWAIIVVAIAVIMALLAAFLPQERLAELIFVTRIFDVMLPVLAVGALVKYVFKQDKENK